MLNYERTKSRLEDQRSQDRIPDSSQRTEQLLCQLGEDSPQGLEPFDQSTKSSSESSTRTEPLCHHDPHNQAPASSTLPGADCNHVTGQASHLVQPVRGSDDRQFTENRATLMSTR